MEIDYKKLIDTVDITDLTLQKVTDRLIKEIFDIDLIKSSATLGDGDTSNDGSKMETRDSFEIQEEIAIPVEKVFMGQEMPLSIWLGYVERLFEDREFIRTQKTRNGISFIGYNKVKNEVETSFSIDEDELEKEIINELKKALKEKIKASKPKAKKSKKSKGKK